MKRIATKSAISEYLKPNAIIRLWRCRDANDIAYINNKGLSYENSQYLALSRSACKDQVAFIPKLCFRHVLFAIIKDDKVFVVIAYTCNCMYTLF